MSPRPIEASPQTNGVLIAGYFFMWLLEVGRPFVNAVVVLHRDFSGGTGQIFLTLASDDDLVYVMIRHEIYDGNATWSACPEVANGVS